MYAFCLLEYVYVLLLLYHFSLSFLFFAAAAAVGKVQHGQGKKSNNVLFSFLFATNTHTLVRLKDQKTMKKEELVLATLINKKVDKRYWPVVVSCCKYIGAGFVLEWNSEWVTRLRKFLSDITSSSCFSLNTWREPTFQGALLLVLCTAYTVQACTQ